MDERGIGAADGIGGGSSEQALQESLVRQSSAGIGGHQDAQQQQDQQVISVLQGQRFEKSCSCVLVLPG